jgi:hypothetical protein
VTKASSSPLGWLMTNGQHATGSSGARNAIHEQRNLLCFLWSPHNCNRWQCNAMNATYLINPPHPTTFRVLEP